jgi:2-polyprenyl-6-methoxyphenol hydroxylase-like FAD-dependent oxidoreductase
MGPADVLVVGAGPTGLTLAAQLLQWGVSVRLIDRATDRVQQSRALAVQPRTLEVLRGLGLADELVRRGNPAVRLTLHTGGRTVRTKLFDMGLADTAYPFLLFVSQAETEAVLAAHLASRGLEPERGVELVGFEQSAEAVTCTLRHGEGDLEHLQARYVVGCDGAYSSVRTLADIPFVGARYPQTFLLADLEADGLETGSVNAFLTERGPVLFFPLVRPASWRVVAMRPQTPSAVVEDGETSATDQTAATDEAVETAATARDILAELQNLTDAASGRRLRLHDPVWATAFRVHHRIARRYVRGRTFLAGDAAHVHSPAGGQGMNTGIQDAWNLGWKLALVARGVAAEPLLDSYDAERRPVGQFVVRFTHRVFAAATSDRLVPRLARTHVAPRLLPLALRFRPGRAAAFRTMSQLGIRYRRSPAVQPPGRPTRRRSRPGDRLPDAAVRTEDGQASSLHAELTAPAFHLLLCGPPDGWDPLALSDLTNRLGPLFAVHHVDRQPGAGVLTDRSGLAFARLGVRESAAILVRPDGHVACRSESPALGEVRQYLARWLLHAAPTDRPGAATGES